MLYSCIFWCWMLQYLYCCGKQWKIPASNKWPHFNIVMGNVASNNVFRHANVFSNCPARGNSLVRYVVLDLCSGHLKRDGWHYFRHWKPGCGGDQLLETFDIYLYVRVFQLLRGQNMLVTNCLGCSRVLICRNQYFHTDQKIIARFFFRRFASFIGLCPNSAMDVKTSTTSLFRIS